MASEFAEDDPAEEQPAAPAAPDAPAADVEMAEGEEGGDNANGSELPYAEGGDVEPRTSFISYLTSPVVTMIVGSGGNETILTAHQALLVQSPYFAEACAAFSDDGSPRQIELVGDETDALPGQRILESDPALPSVDESGDQLLKHARVYTLAEKFGVEKLKSLATSKIHCVNSTAKGEIAYARYVYAYTSKDDTSIRAPVANFWATRSHTLRSEAEEEFRSLCLSTPNSVTMFSTARVLDEKLKRESQSKLHPAPGSGRKRPRHSQV
ncbi:hypothetical protein PG994_011749 [Apiospora phragmitis]|uniref:BTB domain-containing protein n=1 Tax=Apiospora phragmitis TaxID=2905665 RepID=A0ABR1TTP7_9PEZI